MNEFQFIENLTKLLPINDPNVLVGFGDDCACIEIEGKKLLFTIDSQVDEVHFIKEKINPLHLGWKLISVNVSDVVACGGVPKWGLVSVCMDKHSAIFVEEVYKGIKEALDFYKFNIIGGNVSSSEKLGFDLALTGITNRFVSRRGAKTGDKVYLSGYTGLSRAGLELLLMDKKVYEDWELELIEKHTKPTARIDLQPLVESLANACIDISDGLVADIGHISKASSKKISLFKERIPIHPLLDKFCKKYDKNPLEYALYGGEDYELVLTTEKNLDNLFLIGKVEEGEGVYLDNKELKIEGFLHL